jgi:tRNA (mo5U34)-methyltransferase
VPDVIEERAWYHTLTFPDGSVTPGYFDTRSAVNHVRWPAELNGGRCLDVGTFDGFWAFEMEARGAAEVVAVDLDDPEAGDWSFDQRQRMVEQIRTFKTIGGQGFAEAAKRLGSRAQWVGKSVYALDPATDGQFDVVLCGALLLHLRDPVAALEAMRGVCRGVLILVESVDPALDLLARRIPAAQLNPNPMQWWRVNSTGLARLVDVAGFEVEWIGPRFLIHFGAGAPPQRRTGPLAGLAVGRPWDTKGLLHRALVARPRQPRPQ